MRIGVYVVSVLLLAGCFGTPELPLLSAVDLVENAPESGLIAPDVEVPESLLEELESVGNGPVLEAVPSVEVTPQKTRRGLAGLFGRRNKARATVLSGVVDDVTETDGDAAASADVITTSDTSQPEKVATLASPPDAKPARRGLFGPRRNKSGQLQQAPPGVLLPFGQIGLACGLRTKQLGEEVDRFPEGGKGYRLYDTKPATTQPRTHYITGFKDGCPRQFTASLALLESPVLHEQLLLVKSSQGLHSTVADKAFQKIRAQVCRVGRGKACPENRIDEMENAMAFITTYERFGDNASWTEILMHNGAIVANSSQAQ